MDGHLCVSLVHLYVMEGMDVMQEEWGSSFPLGFANRKATLYDTNGKEVQEPLCEICQKEMSPLIGKETLCWYCFEHGFKKDRCIKKS